MERRRGGALLLLCRLSKEEKSYITEAKQLEEKIERLKAEAADEYLIKKQVLNSFKRFTSFLIETPSYSPPPGCCCCSVV